jgi:hypothetical protein
VKKPVVTKLPTTKVIIGSLEMCDLSELGIKDLEVRVDTGAKTSSLHVDNVKRYKKGGKPWVKFDLHPDIHNVESKIECSAYVKDIRKVKSSNGESQQRYVIKTPITMGGMKWDIEITLTDRSDMTYLMLLGREGMGDRVLVDPANTFLLSEDN